MRGQLAAILSAMLLLAAGCGGGSSDTTSTATGQPSAPREAAPASGPAVRICDRPLARQLATVISSTEFHGRPALRPRPTGTARHSACRLGPV